MACVDLVKLPSFLHHPRNIVLPFHNQVIDMPSLKSSVAFMATVILAIGAQAQLTYVIDPNSVPISTRGMPPRLVDLLAS